MTTIYSNYNLFDEEMRAAAVENILENSIEDITEDDITEQEIIDELYSLDEMWYEDAMTEIKGFFDPMKNYILFGSVGRWNGNFRGGEVFSGENFEKVYREAITDCDYIEWTDDNGHLYLKCSHHDGTNHFEIREVTERGEEYFDRWNYNWSDKRSEEYVHNQIINKYSRLPRFAEKVYGIKAKRGA